MRIVLVGPTFPYKGGGAAHTTELAHRLTAAGHSVTIESWKAQYPGFLYPGTQTISAPESDPFPTTRRNLAWYRPDGWYLTGRRLRRTADLVVFAVLSPVQVPAYLGILAGIGRTGDPCGPGDGGFGEAGPREAAAGGAGTTGVDEAVAAQGPGGRSTGRPRTVALCHNVLPHERRGSDVALMRRLLRRVDGVLTHSRAQAGLARSLAPDTPVAEAEMPPHLPGSAVADPGGTAEVHRRLLFFGIVRPYKGLDVLLRALAAGPPDVSLTVAGEFWGGAESTRELIASLGLGDRVELREGYVAADDVPGLFAQADALVLPYRSATASQNAWLGFEHGVPVIATRTGALADHIRENVDGLLCDPDDADSLTQTLNAFYQDGEPQRLRTAVRPVDPTPYWDKYLPTLLST